MTESCVFKCSSNECLRSLTLVCNGVSDCLNGSDENGCPVNLLETPTPNAFASLPGASEVSSIQIIIIVIAIVLKLGLLTCIISHYKMGARSWSERQGRPPPQTSRRQAFLLAPLPHQQQLYLSTPQHSVLYTQHGIQNKRQLELTIQREKQIRQQSVQTDLALNLPVSLTLPDGEEYPYGSSKLLRLRDSQQESELRRGCVQPPPNRTVIQEDGLQAYRSKPKSQNFKSSTPASVLRTIDENPLVIPFQTIKNNGCTKSQALPSYLRLPEPTCDRTTNFRCDNSNNDAGYRGQVIFGASDSIQI
ncbi:low-density lipoprotein receptor class A domain-containing protein 4-like isoform X2 [Limulus polyphemus]|uniref:Low-density lipoprotein receptor class A domain-containing protein 4-like isoform X2 n=1 Tax=Limulus polyphemus TaxID=6850 RepID=A0ABM1BNQ7_LIMPO|nr:low-density lipoprotein receptor class A domain-containing protein 4-like isoform X2 [Limulus polyphemus]